MKKIDDHRYWVRRHRETKGLIGVGQHKYSEIYNFYMYKIVMEVYDKLLEELDLKNKNLRVLDAGCGIGTFTKFLKDENFSVVGADISEDATELVKKNIENVKVICSPLYRLNLPKNDFDIVHCFDVLYHILDDEEWGKTLEKFSQLSRKYIILHESFSNNLPPYTLPHVKFRKYSYLRDKLESLGFKEIRSKPTHILGNRLYLSIITKFFPRTVYRVDRFLIFRLNKKLFSNHFIKVFEKRSAK
ncbi:MAG TPA: class I SAM-dependent methyltransferase [Candidatus Nanoarchaeia archaeon]|nr:class I SAM-dependent methyltransferase [Candidatus Nanoarchaeia archaeon]